MGDREERERLRRLADVVERNRSRFREHMERRGFDEERIEREMRDAERRARELNERAES